MNIVRPPKSHLILFETLMITLTNPISNMKLASQLSADEDHVILNQHLLNNEVRFIFQLLFSKVKNRRQAVMNKKLYWIIALMIHSSKSSCQVVLLNIFHFRIYNRILKFPRINVLPSLNTHVDESRWNCDSLKLEQVYSQKENSLKVKVLNTQRSSPKQHPDASWVYICLFVLIPALRCQVNHKIFFKQSVLY